MKTNPLGSLIDLSAFISSVLRAWVFSSLLAIARKQRKIKQLLRIEIRRNRPLLT